MTKAMRAALVKASVAPLRNESARGAGVRAAYEAFLLQRYPYIDRVTLHVRHEYRICARGLAAIAEQVTA
jgi:hypothetical protein